jgi:hypothetical protein
MVAAARIDWGRIQVFFMRFVASYVDGTTDMTAGEIELFRL